jgi:hypothetical protein
MRIVFILFLLSQKIYGQTSEYELKAVAFQKLSLFIEWPGNVFANNDSDFIIAVLGKNPFGKILEQTYNNVRIKNRNVKIIYCKDLEQLMPCHLLFISETSISQLEKILAKVRSKPVLTIADSEGFAEEGCDINIFNNSGRLRFEINQKVMESTGFTIDYKLLSVSRIVNPVSK